MRVICLQSGSSGNCVYLEHGGTSILVDAGISGREIRNRLARFGIDLHAVHAVVVTHDHADHIGSAAVLGRSFRIPVYVSRGSHRAGRRRYRLDRIHDLRTFSAGETLGIHGVAVETVGTPHDGREPVGLVIRAGGRSVGVLTDLGHVFTGLREVVRDLDAVVLESNYDPDLLESGSYPGWLKARIRGPAGHLSNAECAGLLAGARKLRWACLAHLSEENNRPEVALAEHRALAAAGLPLFVASRVEPVALPEVR